MFFKTVAAPTDVATCPLVFSAPLASGGPVNMLPAPVLAPVPRPGDRPRKRKVPVRELTAEELRKKICEMQHNAVVKENRVSKTTRADISRLRDEQAEQVAQNKRLLIENKQLLIENKQLTVQMLGMTGQMNGMTAQMVTMEHEIRRLKSMISGSQGSAEPPAAQLPVALPPVAQLPATPGQWGGYPPYGPQMVYMMSSPAVPGQWGGYPPGYAGATGFGWSWGVPHS